MKANILTLTPVHIGSGIEIQPDFEYIYFEKQNLVAVLDYKKVLDILGEENLPQWVSCIQNKKPLLQLLETRKKKLKPEDISQHLIKANNTLNKPIRTHLRSKVNNCSILPGSSIKGALRTALFSHLALNNHRWLKDIRNLRQKRNNRFYWKGENLEKKFFGRSPNYDIFRLLRPGDFHFGLPTSACIIRCVNKYKNEFKIKNELTQVVETIPDGVSADAYWSVNKALLSNGSNIFNENVKYFEDVNQLFKVVNSHTKRLVEDEIDFWSNSANYPTCIEDYVDEMQKIDTYISEVKDGECVLRLGWGSGFRFMTGDWHGEMIDDDYDLLVKTLRPKHPANIMFPKSMRIGPKGVPLGFVKISISENKI